MGRKVTAYRARQEPPRTARRAVPTLRISHRRAAALLLLKQSSWREEDRRDVAALKRLQAAEPAT